MDNEEQQLNRLTIFEALVLGIYGNWLISLLDKVSFEKSVWIFGIWYQSLCISLSFLTLIVLVGYSIFAPMFLTTRFGFILGFGHVAGNYGALWAEGFTWFTHFFFWLGTFLFLGIYIIELRRAAITRRRQ